MNKKKAKLMDSRLQRPPNAVRLSTIFEAGRAPWLYLLERSPPLGPGENRLR